MATKEETEQQKSQTTASRRTDGLSELPPPPPPRAATARRPVTEKTILALTAVEGTDDGSRTVASAAAVASSSNAITTVAPSTSKEETTNLVASPKVAVGISRHESQSSAAGHAYGVAHPSSLLSGTSSADFSVGSCSFPGAFHVPGIGEPDSDEQQQQETQSSAQDGLGIVDNATVVEDDEEVDDSHNSGATPVQHEASGDADVEALEEALDVKPMPIAQKQRRSTLDHETMVLGSCLFLGALLAVILIPLLIPSRQAAAGTVDESLAWSNGKLNSEKEKWKPCPPFDDNLHPIILKDIKDHPGSPRHRANQWMCHDPKIQTYPHWRKTQRFAMAVIYYSTKGDDWFRNDHWLSYNVHECEWFSQSPTSPCNDQGQLVTEDFSSNNLGGTIPMEIQLPTVTHVDFSNNHIAGSLPLMLDTNKIEVLIFSNNQIYAENIVASTGYDGTPRKVLKLDGNRLHFTNTRFIRAFPNLEVLNLTSNFIGGTLPAEEMPHLQYMGLGNNLYTGVLPTELGLLSGLVDLDVSNNMGIQGALPAELDDLESLVHLDVSGTQVTGDIPLKVCSRNSTKVLAMSANCSQLRCCI